MYRVEILVNTKEAAETIVEAFDAEVFAILKEQGHEILGILIVDANLVDDSQKKEEENGQN